MALFLGMLKENLRNPWVDDDEAYERVTKGNMETAESFYRAAESGDERAQRIVALIEE